MGMEHPESRHFHPFIHHFVARDKHRWRPQGGLRKRALSERRMNYLVVLHFACACECNLQLVCATKNGTTNVKDGLHSQQELASEPPKWRSQYAIGHDLLVPTFRPHAAIILYHPCIRCLPGSCRSEQSLSFLPPIEASLCWREESWAWWPFRCSRSHLLLSSCQTTSPEWTPLVGSRA